MITKVYCTKSCGWCDKMKTWLRDRSIEFTEAYVDEDEGARNELVNDFGVMSVPLLVSDGKVVKGFKEAELLALFQTA